MSKIIAIHSFRGGTGKSNIIANLATWLAIEGRRVGVIDTDIQSPGIHILFGLDETRITHSLNDYLWGRCNIEQTAHNVTPHLNADIKGLVFLIPSNIKAGQIARILREGYDATLLNEGFHKLVQRLNLDVLLIDTHPGLNEETLLSIAISDVLGVILRPDQQDYQGTSVTMEVARKLEVSRMLLILNKVSPTLDLAEVKSLVERTYNCEVAATLPYAEEMMILASADIFVLRYPNHPVTAELKQLAAKLMR